MFRMLFPADLFRVTFIFVFLFFLFVTFPLRAVESDGSLDRSVLSVDDSLPLIDEPVDELVDGLVDESSAEESSDDLVDESATESTEELSEESIDASIDESTNFLDSIIDNIVDFGSRDLWSQDFEVDSSSSLTTHIPTLSSSTVDEILGAIAWYEEIVAAGGWGSVPRGFGLRIGSNGHAVESLRERLTLSGDLPIGAGLSDRFDSYVESAVIRFQRRHGLPADGIVDNRTLDTLNVPASMRLRQLRENLSRIRALTGLSSRYVLVNIPAARIEAVDSGRVIQRHTAIVGRVSRKTPIISSKIYEFNLNPYWHAPVSIVKRDIIPLVRDDPYYLQKQRIRIYDGGTELDPSDIDWESDEAVRYRFRQDPGRVNAMGTVRINFPNPHAVYMHDTPQQSLFNKLLRFDSSGCVRVQNVRDLLVWLASETPGWSRRSLEDAILSGERIDVKLSRPVPVHLAYISAWSSGGVVNFRDDIYDLDGLEDVASDDDTDSESSDL